MEKARRGLRKSLAWLMVLAIAVTFMPSIAFDSFAASETVTLNYVDKAGQKKEIEKWYYDSSNATYRVGSAEGEMLSIVRDFSTKDAISKINPSLAEYLEENKIYYQADGTDVKTYAIPYTGINRKPDPRAIGISKKGIILDEMLEYLGDKAGLDLKGETTMDLGGGTVQSYNAYWGKDRFYYPEWYKTDSFTAKSFTDEYKGGDTTEGARSGETDIGKGYKVPTTMTITGYHGALYEGVKHEDISAMIGKADELNALRNFQGQLAGGDDNDLNMGMYSWKNISSITFTPVYNAITVTDGKAAEGKTEGEDGYTFSVDKMTVSTSDNYFKAAAGETVKLTVNTESGREVKTVTVTDADSSDVAVKAEGNGVYSFTMPEKAVSVKVEDGYSTDTSWYSKDGKSFEIGTVKELAGLAAIVNGTAEGIEQDDFAGKTVTLKNDIAIDEAGKYKTAEGVFGQSSYAMKATYYTVNDDAYIWTPIGSGEASGNTPSKCNYFRGTFDGAGKTVSGIYTDGTQPVQGLFGCLGEGATVKDLTTEGCITAKFLAGGIAAYDNGATVVNCENKAIVYADGGQVADSGKENGVSRAGAIGGIIGTAAGTSAVKGCINTADITCTNTAKGGRAGGIIGLIDKSDDKVSISECFNKGTVDAYQYAGGIVGMNASKESPIAECGNAGDVIGHSSGKMYVGGIAAQSNSDVTDSYNTGDFIGSIDGTGGDKVSSLGGIVGTFSGKTISGCYNTGKLDSKGMTYSSTGAIAGTGYGTLSSNKLENCYALEGTAYDNKDYLTEKTADEMKSREMLKTLGDKFTSDYDDVNHGYPVFIWQVSSDNMHKIAEDAIDAIGTVTLDSEEAIAGARAAYDALPKAAKKKVENYAELTLAEESFKAIRDTYDKIAAIDDEVTIRSEAKIKAARAAYDALTKDEKKQVKNYSALTVAESDLAEIKAANTPASAASVKASARSYNSVSLSWKAVKGAKGYEIWRATSKNGSYKRIVSSTDKTSYISTSLTTGTTYYYIVKAYGEVDGVKLYAANSAKVSAKPVLSAPAKLKVVKGTKKATVKWSKTAGANGYKIYRSTKKASGYKCVKTVTKGSTVKYTNKGLKKGKTYYYKVKAYRTVAGSKVYSKATTVKSVKVK